MEVNLIKWTDIDSEVEEFQTGYREGFVAIFKKFEGTETDELDAYNRPVKVSMRNFALRYGIAETTFKRWVREISTGVADKYRPGPNQRALDQAAAQAKAEAEAKAATALAAALEAQEKAAAQRERQAALQAKQEQERALKAQQEAIRKEEQAKAKAAADREIAELKAKMAETAKSADFDISTLTEAQKAQVMTLLANDPAQAKEWFAATTAERNRKLLDAEKAAKEAAAKKAKQSDERDARKAAEKARQDYDGSVLNDFTKLSKAVGAMQAKMREKPITFDHILASGMSAQEFVSMTETVEDFAVEVRESIYLLNAFLEIAGE
jgi:hypothetical protein